MGLALLTHMGGVDIQNKRGILTRSVREPDHAGTCNLKCPSLLDFGGQRALSLIREVMGCLHSAETVYGE